jgi:hypothetical protein
MGFNVLFIYIFNCRRMSESSDDNRDVSFEVPQLDNMGPMAIMWSSFFYNPKHCGDRKRLDRLEEQVRIVMRITSLVKCALKSGSAVHECFRTQATIEFLTNHNKKLIDAYRNLSEDMNCRIAKLVLKKRFLLHVLFFIFSKETSLANRHERDLKHLQSLVEEDTEDWMEIIDYVETMKNPLYLYKK